MQYVAFLFGPFVYILLIGVGFVLHFTPFKTFALEIYGSRIQLLSADYVKLFPLSLRPEYKCGTLGGWMCNDTSSSAFWTITFSMIVIPFVFYRFGHQRKKLVLFGIWYASFYIGLLLYFLLTILVFPEPRQPGF